ncbi:hypothetical protein CK934_03825 [Chitinophaga sp. MD30]|nr:hypothetical protein CK934_03825 [Chitinophaga sp. MD30]
MLIPDPEITNLQQLLEKWNMFLSGSQEAFAEIHQYMYGSLYQYALRMLQEPALAEDAVQELFIRLWLKRQRIRPIQNVKAYLLRALRNQVLNQLRQLKSNWLQVQFNRTPDIVFSQEDILVEQETDQAMRQKIQLALNQLPQRQREIIYLRYFEDLSYEQIAQIMHLNYQSALNLVQRAITSLRKMGLSSFFGFLVI